MPDYPIPPKISNNLKERERERQRSITKDKER
jgi:hypothetical protein